ncbi:MAG TPA: EamA family transporter [Alphaproteobacteria bacterium]|nr:EamA family transporter [Alphaproteobacteria bacterium]
MRIGDILLALVAMILWGLNFAVAKLALAEFPPILLAALRFTLVAAVLLPFCPRPPRLRQIVALAGTLGLLHFPMVFSGLSLLDASTSAIVLQLQVPFGVVMAALLLGEKLSWRHFAGMALAFGGVALIAGAPRLEANRHGLLFLLTAAAAWGLATVQLKAIKPVGPLTLNAWLGLFMAVELFAISFLAEGAPVRYILAASWHGWIGVAYTALLSTIAAFGLWARLVSRYTVGQTMPFMLTIPLFAVIGGVILNGDRITPDIAGGGLLTIAGVALIVLKRGQSAALVEAEAGVAEAGVAEAAVAGSPS